MKIFGKRRSRSLSQTRGDGRRLAAAIMPAVAFVAVPRLPPPPFEFQVMRPRSMTALPLTGGAHSGRGNNDDSDDDDEADSTQDYYQQHNASSFNGRNHAGQSNNNARQRGQVLGPPAGFGDTDADSAEDATDTLQDVPRFMTEPGPRARYDQSTSSATEQPRKPKRRSKSVQSLLDEARRKSADGKGKKSNLRSSRDSSTLPLETETVVKRVEETTHLVPPSAIEVKSLSASIAFSEPGSVTSQDRLLEKQNAELLAKQHELETQLKLQHQLQQRAKSASLRPDELNSQEFGTFLRESQSVTEQTLRQSADVRRSLEERIALLEDERNELLAHNEQLKQELMRQQQRTPAGQELPDEVEKLKSIVHRLNQELSRYQTKFRPLSEQELEELPSLPKRGPKPSWQVNTKYLSPLLLAYDDQLKEKDDVINKYEMELKRLRNRIEEMDAVEPLGMTEWRQLREQCRLVLEENELLLEQLNVHQNNNKEKQALHLQEVLKLGQRASEAETETSMARNEAEELRAKYEALRHQHEEWLLADAGKMSVDEHINRMAALKQKQQDEKMSHAKQLDEVTSKLQSVELERDNVQREVDKLNSIVSQLDNELRLRNKSEKKYQKSLEQLQATVDKMHLKGLTVEQYLGSVLKTAAKMAEERDSLVLSVEEHDKAKRKAWKKALAENVNKTKLKEKVLAYRQKAEEKVEEAMKEARLHESELSGKCEEYERQIKHLRLLLKEKDDVTSLLEMEKRSLLDDLETMWQAASKDNRSMRQAVQQSDRKLQQHVGLSSRLPVATGDFTVRDNKDSDCILDILAADVDY